MRKHGWFRPHVRGLTAISSTTLREGGGWWLAGSQLDLDFANDRSYNRKTGYNATPNGLLTYTSPSPKMVYGDDGLLGYAPHNALTYSQDFSDAAWTKTNATVTANAITAPDGAATADKLEAATSAATTVSRQNAITASRATFSIYVKQGSGPTDANKFSVYNATLALDIIAGTLNYSTGQWTYTAGSSGVTVTAEVDGWWRLSFVVSTNFAIGNTLALYVCFTGASETAGEYAYACGAQLSRGPVLFDYLATTSAARYSLPIDHDPITFDPLGVLIEEQRTNLLLRSQEFDNASWSKSSATIAANDAVAPDGTTTADKLKPDAAATNGRVIQTFTGAIGTTYTLSIYAAADEFSNLRLYFDDGATNTASVSYNLTTGAITTALAITGGNWTSAATTYTDVGDGWRRVTLTFTATAVAPTRMAYWCRDTGDGTSGIHVWGAQLEAGAFATSYIQTGSAQVTRAADQVSILTSAFGFSATAGTMVWKGDHGAGTLSSMWSLNDGTTGERINNFTSPDDPRMTISDDVVAVVNGLGSGVNVSAGVSFTTATAWAADYAGISIDGAAVSTDASVTLPTVNDLHFGMSETGGSQLNGHIKRLTYWNTRKPDAELQALSA